MRSYWAPGKNFQKSLYSLAASGKFQFRGKKQETVKDKGLLLLLLLSRFSRVRLCATP